MPRQAVSQDVRDKNFSALAQGLSCYGVTQGDLRRAMRANAYLDRTDPAIFLANLRSASQTIGKYGFSPDEYVRAALIQPSLLYQDGERLREKLTVLTDEFGDAHCMRSYIARALKEPGLFASDPQTIIRNITAVVGHYRVEGLTLESYLGAAYKYGRLFLAKPEVTIARVDEFLRLVAADRELTTLDRASYVQALLKTPSVFLAKPERLFSRYRILNGFYRRGILSGAVSLPDLVFTKPLYLVRSDQFYALRKLRAYVKEIRNLDKPTVLLYPSDSCIERELIVLAGFDPKRKRVDMSDLRFRRDEPKYCERRLIRAGFQAGLFKNYRCIRS